MEPVIIRDFRGKGARRRPRPTRRISRARSASRPRARWNGMPQPLRAGQDAYREAYVRYNVGLLIQ